MTIVNIETGELIDLDRAAAERRAERITLRLDAIADNYRAVLPLIREAIEKRDDIALGYRSPGDYVSDRFGQSLAGLGVDVRRAVVGELTQAGLSTRAIAPVVGASHMTVKRDLELGVTRVTPDQTAGAGEVRADVPAPHDPAPVETPQGEVTNAPEVADRGDTAPRAPRPVVTGIDGKTYPKPEPKAAPRKPLPDAFFRRLYDVRRDVESLHRLTEDDRWTQNAEKVAAEHRNDLLRTRDLLEQVINALPTEESTT